MTVADIPGENSVFIEDDDAQGCVFAQSVCVEGDLRRARVKRKRNGDEKRVPGVTVRDVAEPITARRR